VQLRILNSGKDIKHGGTLYSHGPNGQSYTVSLVTADNLTEGSVLTAQWYNWSSGTVQMVANGGYVNPTTLVALRTPKGVLSEFKASYDGKTTTSTTPVAVPDLKPLQVTSNGGNHLLALSTDLTTCAYAPYYRTTFELLVDGLAEARGVVAAHGNSDLMGCQTLPLAMFAVKDLSPGTHNLTTQWSTQKSGTKDGEASLAMARLLALTR
jgi:hypothetical protein